MSFASAALVPALAEAAFCAAQVANPTAAKTATVTLSALMDHPSLQAREKTLCHSVRWSHPESYNSSDECPTNFPTSKPDAISNPSRYRAQCFRGMPGHHDLGRAEQRGRRPPAAGLC